MNWMNILKYLGYLSRAATWLMKVTAKESPAGEDITSEEWYDGVFIAVELFQGETGLPMHVIVKGFQMGLASPQMAQLAKESKVA